MHASPASGLHRSLPIAYDACVALANDAPLIRQLRRHLCAYSTSSRADVAQQHARRWKRSLVLVLGGRAP